MIGTSAFSSTVMAPTNTVYSADNVIIQENTLKGLRRYSKYYLKALQYPDYQKLLNELSVENPVIGCVINDESKGRHLNSNGTYLRGKAGELGVAQFKEDTFYWMANMMEFGDAEWTNPVHQLIVMDWAFKNRYGNHWTQYKNCIITKNPLN